MPLLLASFSFVLFMHHDALVYSPPAVYDAHKKAAADLPLHAAATSVEATPRRWPPSTRRSRRHPQSHTQYPLPPYLCTQPPPSTSLYTQWPPSPRKPRAAVIAALPRDNAATDLPLHAVAPPPPPPKACPAVATADHPLHAAAVAVSKAIRSRHCRPPCARRRRHSLPKRTTIDHPLHATAATAALPQRIATAAPTLQEPSLPPSKSYADATAALEAVRTYHRRPRSRAHQPLPLSLCMQQLPLFCAPAPAPTILSLQQQALSHATRVQQLPPLAREEREIERARWTG